MRWSLIFASLRCVLDDMPSAENVALRTGSLGGFATLLLPEHVEDAFELSEGKSRAAGFPANAAYRT